MVAKPDEVKQIATQAVTAGLMRVVAAVVDPQTAAKKLVDDVKELPMKAVGKASELPLKVIGQAMELQSQVGDLPKLAAGLPLKIALQAVATGEKVRNLLPGHGTSESSDKTGDAGDTATPPVVAKSASKAAGGAAAWDAAAPKPAPEDYTPPLAGAHTAQAATVRAELKAVPGTPPIVTKAVKAAAKKALAETDAPVVAPAAKTTAAKAPATTAPAAAEPVVPPAAAATAKAVKAAKGTAKKAPAKAPTKTTAKAPAPEPAPPTPAPAPPATPAAAAEPLATVTPIHAGRDGHTDAPLPVTVEAAVGAATDGAALSSAELPLADYGSLSITQIRSRISKLDAVQLVQLRDYERAHADRTPIVTLLETKLAKVTATTVDTASTVSSSAPGETATLIAEAPGDN